MKISSLAPLTSGSRTAKTLKAIAIAGGLAFAATTASAQSPAATYPSKPIKIVVPFPAGGASDILARLVAQRLNTAWGQPVIVENKPGAQASIGASFVAKSEPDGHTLVLMDTSPLILSPSLMPSLSYSPSKDLAPVAIVGFSPHILVVKNDLPVSSVDELAALAKKNPGKLNYGETPGAITHLAGVLLAQKKGMDWNYIPYKGGAQVLADLAGGQIDATMNSFLATYPLVKGGKIKLIAVASPERFKPIPDVPTIAESVPDFVTGSYQAVLAPAGTPKAVVMKLHDEIKRIVASPEMKQKFDEMGTDPVDKTPEQFGEWLAKETAFWSKIVKDGNIKVE